MAMAREQPGQESGWPAPWQALAELCATLQRLESGARGINARQYQLVVHKVSRLLLASPIDSGAITVLRHYPAAAELYENLTYGQGSLVLHNPKHARLALRAARQAIDAVRGAVR